MTRETETRWEFSGAVVALVLTTIVIGFVVGIWVGLWLALLLVVGLPLLVVATIIARSVRRAHPPAANAPRVAPIDDTRYRILVIADERSTASGFVEQLQSHARGKPVAARVMAPALESRLGLLTEDDEGYAAATARLGDALDVLRRAGVQADGEISSNDPLQAADDGLREFPADEIFFVIHPDSQGNWLEKGVVASAEQRYEVPVSHFYAD